MPRSSDSVRFLTPSSVASFHPAVFISVFSPLWGVSCSDFIPAASLSTIVSITQSCTTLIDESVFFPRLSSRSLERWWLCSFVQHWFVLQRHKLPFWSIINVGMSDSPHLTKWPNGFRLPGSVGALPSSRHPLTLCRDHRRLCQIISRPSRPVCQILANIPALLLHARRHLLPVLITAANNNYFCCWLICRLFFQQVD